VASLLKLAKLDWSASDDSTLCQHQQDLTVTILCRPSASALHLLVNSTGLKALGEGEWSRRKHGASRPRQLCKVRPGIDAKTLEVRAIEGGQANATGSTEPENGSLVDDAPMLPTLLEQIPPEEPIGTVTAEGAYDSRVFHAAIDALEATPLVGAPIPRLGS
jgi:hypothetical protein